MRGGVYTAKRRKEMRSQFMLLKRCEYAKATSEALGIVINDVVLNHLVHVLPTGETLQRDEKKCGGGIFVR